MSQRPRRAPKPPPLSYWEEFVETDKWYVKKIVEDVPEEELHAALYDEDYSHGEDALSGDESEEEATEREKVEFLALGDFGFGNSGQKQVAGVMKSLATKNGLDYIVSVGDNIYGSGATSVGDRQWKTKWSDIYDDNLQVPWYAVLGNHDWESKNPHSEIDKTKQSTIWNLPGFF